MNNNFGFNFLRVLACPSVAISDTRSLPESSGIYYAVRGSQVLYVGLSKNLYQRWNAKGDRAHSQKAGLLKQGGVTLFYRLVSKHRLLLEEAKEIAIFDPPLNKQKPDPRIYDRGLAGLESNIRTAFWTFVWGVTFASVPLGLVLYPKLQTLNSHFVPPTSQPDHQEFLGESR